VGKSGTVVRLPYLLNGKQQDGRSTYVCFRFLRLMIKNSWIGQVKFGAGQIVTLLRTVRK